MLTGFSNIIIDEYHTKVSNNTPEVVYESGDYKVSITAEIATGVNCSGFTAKLETSTGVVSEYIETVELNNSVNSFSFEFPDAIVLETPQVVTYIVSITPNYEGAKTISKEYTIAYTNGYQRKVVMCLALMMRLRMLCKQPLDRGKPRSPHFSET